MRITESPPGVDNRHTDRHPRATSGDRIRKVFAKRPSYSRPSWWSVVLSHSATPYHIVSVPLSVWLRRPTGDSHSYWTERGILLVYQSVKGAPKLLSSGDFLISAPHSVRGRFGSPSPGLSLCRVVLDGYIRRKIPFNFYLSCLYRSSVGCLSSQFRHSVSK